MPAKASFSLDEQGEVFFTSTAASPAVRGLLRTGRVRHVGGRLYTKNLDEPLEEVLRRRAWDVAAGVFPGAVVVDRTAFESRAAGPEGSIFLCSQTARVVRLPGLVLNCRRGAGPASGDTPFLGALYLSSWPRRFLDNMRQSRARSGTRRTLSRQELEVQLERLLANQGESELNRLRDEAAEIAGELDRERELADLSSLIGALLGTRAARLASPLGKATRAGESWDEARLALFDTLFAALHERVPVDRPAAERISPTFSFYEAYFSNFIEGTEFTIEEAHDIVFRAVVPVDRPHDAHDVLGTFDLVSDPGTARRDALQYGGSGVAAQQVPRADHGRSPGGAPGPLQDPQEPSRRHRVRSAEPRAWNPCTTGSSATGHWSGFARAVFAMFLVAEVHPFSDGNGRVARAIANAELSAVGQQRLMIPVVYRDDYLQALRAMSRLSSPSALIRTLAAGARRGPAAWTWSSMRSAERSRPEAHKRSRPLRKQRSRA